MRFSVGQGRKSISRAARIGHLRDQADVGEVGASPWQNVPVCGRCRQASPPLPSKPSVIQWTCQASTCSSSPCQFVLQVSADAQIVDRVNIAGDRHRRVRAPARGQAHRPAASGGCGNDLIEIFDDGERLGDRMPVMHQRRHQPLRIEALVIRARVARRHSCSRCTKTSLGFDALQVQRDADAERRRGAEIGVERELHRLIALHLSDRWRRRWSGLAVSQHFDFAPGRRIS